MKASAKGWIAPSTAALAKAREKLSDIWGKDALDPLDMTPALNASKLPDLKGENAFMPTPPLPTQPSPQRLALRGVENSLNTPAISVPSGFTRPSMASSPHPLTTPISLLKDKSRPKAFKSPLLKPNTPKEAAPSSSSHLNSHITSSTTMAFASARSQHPVSSSSPNKALLTENDTGLEFTGPSLFKTPVRPHGSTQRAARTTGPRTAPAPFVTPFKAGMRPGQPGRLSLLGSGRKGGTSTPSTVPCIEKSGDNWLTRERVERIDPVRCHRVFDLGECLRVLSFVMLINLISYSNHPAQPKDPSFVKLDPTTVQSRRPRSDGNVSSQLSFCS